MIILYCLLCCCICHELFWFVIILFSLSKKKKKIACLPNYINNFNCDALSVCTRVQYIIGIIWLYCNVSLIIFQCDFKTKLSVYHHHTYLLRAIIICLYCEIWTRYHPNEYKRSQNVWFYVLWVSENSAHCEDKNVVNCK